MQASDVVIGGKDSIVVSGSDWVPIVAPSPQVKSKIKKFFFLKFPKHQKFKTSKTFSKIKRNSFFVILNFLYFLKKIEFFFLNF